MSSAAREQHRLRDVPENIHFARTEEQTLESWQREKAFERSLELTKGRPEFTFYDGPPFATGLPHYGHFVASTIKDVTCRYYSMAGYHVRRRFGWDCHGLPVEYEIDKLLGITCPDDVKKMGIKKYNDECRAIVMRYSGEWRKQITRIGRWIDFDNDYKTMYPWFMESVWHVFSELFNKGLVYRGVKVMPYSWAVNTSLSNFEAGLNYQDVQDPAVTVMVQLSDEPDVFLLIWTTTPWTLPANMAVCVHPKLTYAKVLEKSTGRKFIVMEQLLPTVFKKAKDKSAANQEPAAAKPPTSKEATPEPQQGKKKKKKDKKDKAEADAAAAPAENSEPINTEDLPYEVLQTYVGAELKDRQYEPILPYFSHLKKERNAFRVLNDEYVTTATGTGLVHQAPYHGEDDYRVCLREGVISREMKPVCPLDDCGKFTEEVTDFKGLFVKDADSHIMRHLKAAGRLFQQATLVHSYPHCYRSNKPLLYKAVPSWFIRVQQFTDRLLANNQKCYWVPNFVKEKRFANWLENAIDWSFSRNRYWGTPIPLWVSDDGEEVVCVGSIERLEELTGQKVTDLHRENIDHLTIPSARGKGVLRRVPEVFDCWFESGSMPYAQCHWPFENKKHFDENFPANFIAEGIDQTRGWFYTLLVLSTLLFDRPPFKNVIVNGLVLAEDGNKMSKSKKNFPDPSIVVDKYGADALRLYLINSPVVRGENLRFREPGVHDVQKDCLLPMYHGYRFMVQQLRAYEDRTSQSFAFNAQPASSNEMDRWIVSEVNSLVKFVHDEMTAFRLYTVVPRLVKFIETLTNWYVRMNRKRLKGDMGTEDCQQSLESLTYVFDRMVRVMAPAMPFITDYMWHNLARLQPEGTAACVHHMPLPTHDESQIDSVVERRVQAMQTAIDLCRVARDRRTLPIKQPLPEVIVLHRDDIVREDVLHMQKYVCEEANVARVVVSADQQQWNVRLRAKLEYRVVAPKVRQDMKKVEAAVKELTDAQLEAFSASGALPVAGYNLTSEDLTLSYELAGHDTQKYEPAAANQMIILLNTEPDEEMIAQGYRREIINRVQKLRKKAKLQWTDQVVAYCSCEPADSAIGKVLASSTDYIAQATKQPVYASRVPEDSAADVIDFEQHSLKDTSLSITLVDVRPPEQRVKPRTQRTGDGGCLCVQRGTGKQEGEELQVPVNGGISLRQLLREVRAAWPELETQGNLNVYSDAARTQLVQQSALAQWDVGRALYL